MHKLPKISVVIPCYNHSNFIEECLDSVFVQSFKDFQCTIVDDESTDNSKYIITQWIKKKGDLRFRYLFQNHGGVSKARNLGISHSIGEFILPLDADDKISSNYLESGIKEFDVNSNLKLVYGNSYLLKKNNKKWNLEDYHFEDLLYKNMIHCSGFFKKKDWEIIGGYDENMVSGLEDWEFWINLLKDGGEVKKDKNARFYYRIKEVSLNKTVIDNSYGYKQRQYIFQKHKSLYIKTNAYDLYYENYNLKKRLRAPYKYYSFFHLLKFIFQAVTYNMNLFFKKKYHRFFSLINCN